MSFKIKYYNQKNEGHICTYHSPTFRSSLIL